MQPLVSIITLNWNGYRDTIELLKSLENLTYTNYKIYIVDNNSEGDDLIKLKEYTADSEIIIIANKENSGFSGGNNLGIKEALNNGTDYILLINNDTIVEPDFLEILVEGCGNSEMTGITGPRINYYYEREKIWSSGGKLSSIRASGFAIKDVLDAETDNQTKEVTFVSGCCMLIKKSVLETVGYFDNNYFVYVEDTDFCARTVNSGYKILVIPKAKIYHKVKGSSAGMNDTTLYYETRNRLFFAKKNFSRVFAFSFMYLFTTMLVKSMVWLFSGKTRNIISLKDSFRDFFQGHMGKREVQRTKAPGQ